MPGRRLVSSELKIVFRVITDMLRKAIMVPARYHLIDYLIYSFRLSANQIVTAFISACHDVTRVRCLWAHVRVKEI